jgi:hypothetical protein
MKLRAVLAFALLCLPGMAAADHQLVLVTADSCPADEISMLDVRKAYLGIGVELQDRQIRAYRLVRDERIERIFFQNVVAMSQNTYERRMLSLMLKYGRPRPREFTTTDALAEALGQRECGIGYMWHEQAILYSSLKVIKVLWQGS